MFGRRMTRRINLILIAAVFFTGVFLGLGLGIANASTVCVVDAIGVTL